MRTYILSCLLLTACSKGDAQPAPAPQPKPNEAPTAPTPAPTKPAPPKQAAPKPTPAVPSAATAADGLAIMKAIGAKKTDNVKLEINRKFVSITISPATGKKTITLFCPDDDRKTFDALPKRVADHYGARIAAALADPDQGVQCTADQDRVLCDVGPQDEHERALTFLIVKEAWGPVLAGYVERETWMVDPDSAKYKADLRERDATFAKATTDDCFQPESSRGRE